MIEVIINQIPIQVYGEYAICNGCERLSKLVCGCCETPLGGIAEPVSHKYNGYICCEETIAAKWQKWKGAAGETPEFWCICPGEETDERVEICAKDDGTARVEVPQGEHGQRRLDLRGGCS
jgi:hypothetical protein